MKITPTIRMVLDAYPKIAAVERLRMERPGERAVGSAVNGFRRLCEIGNLALDEPISILTRKRLDLILDAARCSGLKPVTIWSYIYSLRTVFARWTRRYYADKKWAIPKIDLPSCRRQSPRYVRPDLTILAKVKEWYRNLEQRKDQREWVLATLMLEFAMRNGDVERLRWADFRPRRECNYGADENKNAVFLCYTPHKTRLSSGRVVAWPVHPEIWARLCDYHDAGIPYYRRKGWLKNSVRDSRLVVPCARDVYMRLNHELRVLKIFTGAKGCYELRKICIDHIYQKFGVEMASSISGDDIRTITRYYADPSAVCVDGIRVVDLF